MVKGKVVEMRKTSKEDGAKEIRLVWDASRGEYVEKTYIYKKIGDWEGWL